MPNLGGWKAAEATRQQGKKFLSDRDLKICAHLANGMKQAAVARLIGCSLPVVQRVRRSDLGRMEIERLVDAQQNGVSALANGINKLVGKSLTLIEECLNQGTRLRPDQLSTIKLVFDIAGVSKGQKAGKNSALIQNKEQQKQVNAEGAALLKEFGVTDANGVLDVDATVRAATAAQQLVEPPAVADGPRPAALPSWLMPKQTAPEATDEPVA